MRKKLSIFFYQTHTTFYWSKNITGLHQPWSYGSWIYNDLYNYAISAYHHWCCEFLSRSGRGVQHYVIKFVNDLRQVSGFLQVLRFPPLLNKTDSHDIIEILLKVALNTIRKYYGVLLILVDCKNTLHP